MARNFSPRFSRFASFRRTKTDATGVVTVAPRREPGKMNQNEERYAAHLTNRPDVREWHYEAMKLRLADATFIELDFWVILVDGSSQLHEVKDRWGVKIKAGNPGKIHIEDDARVKLKWCQQKYPMPISVWSFNKITGQWEADTSI